MKSLVNNLHGLGNSRTHKLNYNIVGKNADARLDELGGKRLHALGLGDGSDCIEDDFDSLSKSLIETLSSLDNNSEAVGKAEQNTNKGANIENIDAKAVSVSVLRETKKWFHLYWICLFLQIWQGK
jgi:hypothetical protein